MGLIDCHELLFAPIAVGLEVFAPGPEAEWRRYWNAVADLLCANQAVSAPVDTAARQGEYPDRCRMTAAPFCSGA